MEDNIGYTTDMGGDQGPNENDQEHTEPEQSGNT
jgi:hypothetical protein